MTLLGLRTVQLSVTFGHLFAVFAMVHPSRHNAWLEGVKTPSIIDRVVHVGKYSVHGPWAGRLHAVSRRPVL